MAQCLSGSCSGKSVVRVKDSATFAFEFRYVGDLAHYSTLSTKELRELFLVQGLFTAGKMYLVHTDLDRAIIGGVVPTTDSLSLNVSVSYLASKTFLDRRELSVMNLGGKGYVTVGDKKFAVGSREVLYCGLGAGEVTFYSESAQDPALFYLVSYPAHAAYPTKLITAAEAETTSAGSADQANLRKINKMVHPNGARSCQLVLGFTELATGSIWNTMPPHLHPRRTEIYLYTGLGAEDRVFHLMGTPDDTRKIVVANLEVVLSPPWSIHSGAGTRAYTFVWAMGGENQDFNDVDPLKVSDLI